MQANTQTAPSAADNISPAIHNTVAAFDNAEKKSVPYTYWLFENALPSELCQQIIALPINPAGEYDTQGKRDSHNELRRFFSPEMQAEYATMKQVANLFQNSEVFGSRRPLIPHALTQ